jgi:hypothetical protein
MRGIFLSNGSHAPGQFCDFVMCDTSLSLLLAGKAVKSKGIAARIRKVFFGKDTFVIAKVFLECKIF